MFRIPGGSTDSVTLHVDSSYVLSKLRTGDGGGGGGMRRHHWIVVTLNGETGILWSPRCHLSFNLV